MAFLTFDVDADDVARQVSNDPAAAAAIINEIARSKEHPHDRDDWIEEFIEEADHNGCELILTLARAIDAMRGRV